jgi:hypothetical protein
MTVFELLGTSAWASRGEEHRIGLFSTLEKARAKVAEIKKGKAWKMDWDSFRIVEVKVE